jgi:serine/threonine-protein kinase
MAEPNKEKKNRQIGPYQLLEKIGQGGMSTVFKAVHLESGRPVAIKLALRYVLSDPHLSRRFEMEYSVAQPLDHPHLVKVLDYGKHDQVPYLVMEFVDGISLAHRLHAEARLPEQDALAIVLPIADALRYLHENKIIHRDIKPGNILLSSTGSPKLADLGLIKDLESNSKLTRSQMGLGTMQYASPEQFESANTADARCDLYSLAVTLYQLLTGEYPFGDGPKLSVMTRKLSNQFMAPMHLVPNLSAHVNAAICKCLQMDPELRCRSMADFILALTTPAMAGDTPIPASPAPVRRDPRDRRRAFRNDMEIEASCRAVVGAAQRWKARVMDLSVSGVRLWANRRFEVGSLIEVAFSPKSDGDIMNQVMHVRWVKSAEGNTWMLGCEFAYDLSETDLNSIVAYRKNRPNGL